MSMSPQVARSPLRKIVARPSAMLETLECGHTITRPVGLGELIMVPSNAKRRRCLVCGETVPHPHPIDQFTATRKET